MYFHKFVIIFCLFQLGYGSTLCNRFEQLCGGKCFNPEIQTCLPDPTTSYKMVCKYKHGTPCSASGSSTANPKCYSSSYQSCHTHNGVPFVCEVYENFCETHPPQCYTAALNKCLEKSNGQKVLCSESSFLCNDKCYDIRTHVCRKSKTSNKEILCKAGYVLCGESCYHTVENVCYT